MNKYLFLFFSFCCLFPFASGFSATNPWSLHLSYHDGKQCLRAGEELYALFGENLLIYNISTTEITTVDRVSHGLNGKRIKEIGYSKTRKLLVLLYADGNIDLFSPQTGEVTNLPQIKRDNDSDIQLHQLSVRQDHAFISTNVGFFWVDLAKREFRGFYRIGSCNDVAIFGQHIFVARTVAGVIYARSTDNLSDTSLWKNYFPHKTLSLISTASALHLITSPSEQSAAGVWYVAASPDADTPLSARQIGNYSLTGAHADVDDNVVAVAPGHLLVYAKGGETPEIFTRPSEGNFFEPDGKGGFWVALDGRGVVSVAPKGAAIDYAAASLSIGGFGPRYDRQYYMTYDGADLLVAAGRLDPTDADHLPQTAMLYDGQRWKLFDAPTTADGYIGSRFEDATCIATDPHRKGRYFVSTARTGIYEYDFSERFGKIARQYSRGNSALNSVTALYKDPVGVEYVRTDGVVFDKAGNLFVVNNQRDTTLWVLKPDGSWKGLYHPSLKQAPTLEKTLIDSRGRLWVASRRTVNNHAGGFFCIDYNGTIDNTDDDIAVYRSSFFNQDGASCIFQRGFAMVEDKDGAVWLGTDQGIFKVEDPDRWFNKDFHVTQVKVPRNDGTNYADYLLSGVAVTAIAIDGANRKWIGTEGNGIYLFSPDGERMILHFTSADSPLLSDNIWSIACHPVSGQVMIATDSGLLSYESHVSEPLPSLRREALRVYPNPVRPDYEGDIVLDGLVSDADIKVTDAGGRTVAHGTSLGGTFIWNGRGYDGTRVGSGIYYFHIASPDSKNAVAAKVAIIR